MEEDKNPLLKATFEWNLCNKKRSSSTTNASGNIAGQYTLRNDYRRDPGRIATLITRFPTGAWVALADVGMHGQEPTDQVQPTRRRRKKQRRIRSRLILKHTLDRHLG